MGLRDREDGKCVGCGRARVSEEDAGGDSGNSQRRRSRHGAGREKADQSSPSMGVKSDAGAVSSL